MVTVIVTLRQVHVAPAQGSVPAAIGATVKVRVAPAGAAGQGSAIPTVTLEN
jgi:hypothetical protein